MMIYFIFALILLLLFIFSVLVFPIHILISYNRSLSIKVKLFFVSINLFPFSEKFIKNINNFKKTNPNKKPKKHKKSKTEYDNILNKIKFSKTIVSLLFYHLKKVIKKINFKINYLKLGITGEDAADTAIKYEKYRISISALFPFFRNILSFKEENINIYPNFLESEFPLEFDFDISFKLIFILYEMLIFTKNYVKIPNEKISDNIEGVYNGK